MGDYSPVNVQAGTIHLRVNQCQHHSVTLRDKQAITKPAPVIAVTHSTTGAAIPLNSAIYYQDPAADLVFLNKYGDIPNEFET